MRPISNTHRLMKLRRITTLMAALLMLALLAGATSAAGPVALWSDVAERSIVVQGERVIVPTQYRVVALNQAALRDVLARAPLENSPAAKTAPIELALPLPDGTFGRFNVIESPIMEASLAAKYPEIKTFAGQGVDDSTAMVRLDRTPLGFHAMILSARGTIYIDPYSRNDTTHYISYDTRDFKPVGKTFSEGAPTAEDLMQAKDIAALLAQHPHTPVGTQLRTYRLAVGATGEYTAYQGGTVVAGLAAVVTSVNRVDGIYERDVAVRMVLVANNNLIIYTDGTKDPYTNGNPSSLLTENQANLDSVIGSANYDIGHVFSTAGGGLAALGVPCRSGVKARGETGTSAPVGDPFDVDYVAHEMGHQFGGNHTFNSIASNCGGGNRAASAAYEPGSASTIMGYAGICGADDLQPHSDDYFHTKSFDEIVAYTTVGQGNTCPVITSTGNAAPVPNAGAGYTIPAQTPFTLTGSATDADSDPLTYNWEEYDLGAAGPPNNPLNPPFFRSFLATLSPARTFPKWSDIVNNTTTIGEILPNITRAMVFRLTVRDNRSGGGGVDWASTTLNVTTAAGPFQVTSPNTAVTLTGNTAQTVTWNVANTTAAPVNCAAVNLRLSTDGGYTYPITVATGLLNNGSASVTLPNTTTTTARLQVACANNIFFDISNANFTIVPGAPQADLNITQDPVPASIGAGQLLTYVMSIANLGPDAASSVMLTDSVPAQTTFVALDAADWSCSTPPVGSTGPIACSNPGGVAGGMISATLVVKVDGFASGGTPITHTVEVGNAVGDPNPGNNVSTTITYIQYRLFLPVTLNNGGSLFNAWLRTLWQR